jgi:GTP pyrophosphokinase
MLSKEVFYNGYKCRVLKVWDNHWYDLETVEHTEKGVIETFLSVEEHEITDDLTILKNLYLAPYILKATALIGVRRKIGGNQFRHCFSTLGILLDYKYFHDSVLLKAALLHDLFEDLPIIQIDEIRNIDHDGENVVNLILEVTKMPHIDKDTYLHELLMHGSRNAKILKCADRISNLTDLNLNTHTNTKLLSYLEQTERYILPMALEVNMDFYHELVDLINKRMGEL